MLIASDKTKTSDLPHLEYNGNPLEWVEGFNYLGVYLNQKGYFQPKEAPIWVKATKAQFKLARMTSSLSFDMKLWLHQVMVDPILLHGAEIWACQGRGQKVCNQGIYATFQDQGLNPLCSEATKRSFVRTQMGLPRMAPMVAIRGDSGVWPLYMEGIARSIMYWQKLELKEPDSLLGITLKTQKQMAESRIDCWLGTLQTVIREAVGHDNVTKILKSDVLEALQEDFEKGWYNSLWKKNNRIESAIIVKIN